MCCECADLSSAKSVAELYIRSVSSTWNIYGLRASCVTTAEPAMVKNDQRTNSLQNVSLHAVLSITVVLPWELKCLLLQDVRIFYQGCIICVSERCVMISQYL